MKALTLYQPWAAWVAYQYKRYETRSWRTNYRGPIAIHAAKTRTYLDYRPIVTNIPFMYGAVIAIAELLGVHPIVEDGDGNPRILIQPGPRSTWATWCPIHRLYITEHERVLGKFSEGRFAWEIDGVRRIKPIPARGKQGLWNWEEPQNLEYVE